MAHTLPGRATKDTIRTSPMSCVILQPGFIPWRGYFHQIQRADVFVFYDCMQYGKHDWRNRSRVKIAQGSNGSRSRWSLVTQAPAHHRTKLPQSAVLARHPPLVEDIYALPEPRLADITCTGTEVIARRLGITQTRAARSSTPQRPRREDRPTSQILGQVGAAHHSSGPSAGNYIQAAKLTKPVFR
ncbi:WbqC-like protein family protein [Nitrosospira sp. Nsp18]|nr:WbqC family protein [Nitrosospira sp. Nsp18]SDA27929.1 WbqC-like protein family protein [Nitrosospira sp. Nsp18]